MKIKELIEKLQEIEAKEGDIEIWVFNGYSNLIDEFEVSYSEFAEYWIIQ